MRISRNPTALGGRIAGRILGLLAGAAMLWYGVYDWAYVLVQMLTWRPFTWWLLYWVPVQTLWVTVGLAASVWMVLGPWRIGTRLDGTVLTVRGLWRTRKVDLATAHVRGVSRAGEKSHDVPLLYLVATDPGTGREAELQVGDGRGLLPREQLLALMDAIAAGGLEDDDRRALVERVRYFLGLRFPLPARFLWADPPAPRRPEWTTGRGVPD